MTDESSRPGDRIAKVIARAGLASRRDAEAMVEALRVRVNGRTVSNVATNVGPDDRVTVDDAPLPRPEGARLWLYHKPVGLVTTERDEKGRETVFDALPPELGRVLSVGRLDINSEGLLLLTNDGDLKRALELPATGWLRRYRVRVNGTPAEGPLDRLRAGIEVDGPEGRETFAPMQVTLDRQQGANAWLTIGLREGRNREVRRALVAVDLYVNRLIRVSYGPFQLGQLPAGAVEEVKPRVLGEQLGGIFDGELARGRQGGPMAADDGEEGRDARAGRDGTGPAKGRKPRPSGDRLVEHGRGGAGKPRPDGGGSAGTRRADVAEGRADRAARPDRPRTAKPPVTRNDGNGSRPDRPQRDLDARHRGDAPRRDGPQTGGEGKPRAETARKPWSKDGPRPAKPAGERPARAGERPRRDGDRTEHGSVPRKPWAKSAERPAGDRAARANDRDRPKRDGDRPDAPRKPWAKDGERAPRPAGDRGARAPDSGRPKRDADRPTGPRKPWVKDGERATRPAGERKPWAKDGARPAGTGRSRDDDRTRPRDGAGPRDDRPSKASERPPRDGTRAQGTPGDAPKETKTARTARLRADTSVSLRKGGQRGRGVVKAKPAPSTKKMRKPEDKTED